MSAQTRIGGRCRRWTALLSCVWLAGCASYSVEPADPLPTLEGVTEARWAMSREPRPVDEILAVNDQMRQFVRSRVSRHASRTQKLRQLTRAVLHPTGLGVRYNNRMTRTASEAFAAAEGNCIALSILFVALAREVNLDAQFFEVEVVPEWTLAGDILFANRHINVGSEIGIDTSYVLDFMPYRARRQIGRVRLRDKEAIAQYYNNIGAELLAEGDLPAAYRHFERGIELAPQISFLWSNLSVVYSRNRQSEDAEMALQRAISLDASNTSAMINLARIYEVRGEMEKADALSQQASVVQSRNPYYQFSQGERYLADARLSEALELLERAIALEPREPMFYARAAHIAQRLQRDDLAARYADLARRYSERPKTPVRSYRGSLQY